MRLLAPARDFTAERSLVAGLVRQFWLTGDEGDPSFREGLVVYIAIRGIHTVLEGRNFAAPRFLGGFVPAPIRSLVLSPSLGGPRPLLGEFDEVFNPARRAVAVRAAGDGTPARGARPPHSVRSSESSAGRRCNRRSPRSRKCTSRAVTPEASPRCSPSSVACPWRGSFAIWSAAATRSTTLWASFTAWNPRGRSGRRSPSTARGTGVFAAPITRGPTGRRVRSRCWRASPTYRSARVRRRAR